jgi:hypothetical protein
MKAGVQPGDRFGLVRPAVDAHTLGLSSVQEILAECGYESVDVDASASEAFGRPEDPSAGATIERWIREHRVTVLGFSFRLDPSEGAALLERLVRGLRGRRLFRDQGGPLRAVYFAGLPEACRLVRARSLPVAGVFRGDETPAETLRILGIDPGRLPARLAEDLAYDEARLSFGRDLVRKGAYLAVRPVDRSGYEGHGTERDGVVARVRDGMRRGLPPLVRAHVGLYLVDRAEAVRLFLEWTRQLAAGALLDVLSIGTSQLAQSRFGEEWGDAPDGGGVPLNAREEYEAVWHAARPMLVRTYAGTRNVPAMARLYEETIHIAWHALSLWWFCRIDGRGPYSVRENLEQHIETLRYIAATGKPFEPNIPHHFAFRGADDATCVVSAALAAKTAKRLGVRALVLQNMLNTPKSTWGIQDLAKSRAMLQLVRELEDERFLVFLQPRAGLDHFSPDLARAKVQLAAVTALMDDIEPHDPASPPIIHVVSYPEAVRLADPLAVNESIQITRQALEEYRRLRAKGEVDDMASHPEVKARTEELVREARTVLRAIETAIPDAYTAEGLYRVFAAGFLPAPYLWECRDEFRRAVAWTTRLVHGSVKVVDERGQPMSAAERVERVSAMGGEDVVHDRTRRGGFVA